MKEIKSIHEIKNGWLVVIREDYLISWKRKKELITKRSKVLDKQGRNYVLKCDNYKFCISDNDLISRRFLIKNI